MSDQPSTSHSDFSAPRHTPPADAWSSDSPRRSQASSSAGGHFFFDEPQAELAQIGNLLASLDERLARIESQLLSPQRDSTEEPADLFARPAEPRTESPFEASPLELNRYPAPELRLP